ncbi:MAG: hypothetical protein WA057_03065 [Candidatus Magasanikiibacteriota bacterium]
MLTFLMAAVLLTACGHNDPTGVAQDDESTALDVLVEAGNDVLYQLESITMLSGETLEKGFVTTINGRRHEPDENLFWTFYIVNENGDEERIPGLRPHDYKMTIGQKVVAVLERREDIITATNKGQP